MASENDLSTKVTSFKIRVNTLFHLKITAANLTEPKWFAHKSDKIQSKYYDSSFYSSW